MCCLLGRVNGCCPPGFSRQHPESCLARRITTTSLCLRAGSAEACVHRMRGPMGGMAACACDHTGPMDPSELRTNRESRPAGGADQCRLVRTPSLPRVSGPLRPMPRVVPIKPRTPPSWEFLLFSFFSLQQAVKPSRASSYTPVVPFFVPFLFRPSP